MIVSANGTFRPPVVQVAFVTSAPRIVLAGQEDPVGDADVEPYIRLLALPPDIQKLVLGALKKGGENAGSVGSKEEAAERPENARS